MAEQHEVFDNIKSFVFDFSDFLSSLFYSLQFEFLP